MNLAILGAGMIVHDFLTVAGDVPQLELSAIFGTENDLEKMNHLKQQYNIQTVYTELEACLADPSVDTVYVALPNHLHYSFAKEAILAGKHVICEKPFTLQTRELVELAELAAAHKVLLIEAITNQYLANYQGIKAQLETLGELEVIECNYSQYSSRYDLFK